MRNWKLWAKAAAVRAVKTMAQTAVATIGVAAVMQDVNWIAVGSAALLAGVLSVLTSVAGLPEADKENRPTAEKLPDGIGLFGFILFWVISAKFIQRDTQGIGEFDSSSNRTSIPSGCFLYGSFWKPGKICKLLNRQPFFHANLFQIHFSTSFHTSD